MRVLPMKQRLRPLIYYCLLTVISCRADGTGSRQEGQDSVGAPLRVVSVVRYEDHGDDSQPGSPTLVSKKAIPAFASIEQDSMSDLDNFCRTRTSQKHTIQNDAQVCKQFQKNDNTTSYHESHMLNYTSSSTLSCGPNCRPSCLTLLLDLEKHKPTCAFTTCQENCQVTKEAPICTNESCDLADAKCLGPIVYDDHVSFLHQHYPEFPEKLPHTCSYVPNDALYNRFRGWPIVHPMEVDCQDSCFADESKIYFEYCHVVNEDPMCDSCGDRDCEADCAMHVAPFLDGWTSFVVAASIPLDDESSSSSCTLKDHTTTGRACWMERIDVFFPSECPHCNECQLVSLGDQFGPLEVVGFGHNIGQACAPCDGLSELDLAYNMECDELKQCEKLRNCETGDSYDLPSFAENQCSWKTSSVQEDGFKRDDASQRDEMDDFGRQKGIDGSRDQELSPGSVKQLSTMLPLFIPICVVVAGLLLLSFTLTRRRRKSAVGKSSHEETCYSQDQRFNEDRAIAIFLSDSEDNSSVLATSSQDNNMNGTNEEIRGERRGTAKSSFTSTSDQASVASMEFRTASLIHQQGRNEVEVMETTGTHNVNVRWV